MKFEDVVVLLQKKINEVLPGTEAHLRMAPANRKPSAEYLAETKNYRIGCVMALLFPDKENGDAKIILMHRTSDAGVHSDQISFPGGKQEEGDENVMHTALRETEEEIGIIATTINVIGPLTTLYIPPSNFLVHPFIGVINYQPVFIPSEMEVKDIITPSLDFFLDQKNIHQGNFSSDRGFEVNAPYYALDNYKIWGATAMMISEITALL